MVEEGEKSIEVTSYLVRVGHEKGSMLIGTGEKVCMAMLVKLGRLGV
jgi:hypothetical protein